MLCEACQEVEAEVHLANISDGVKQVKHLCEACAHRQDLPHPVIHAPIQEILQNLVDVQSEAEDCSCPTCGMTLSRFRRHGRLGCIHDYDLFGAPLTELLERIHGKTTHSGKRPGTPSPELALEKTRRQLVIRLDHAIKDEAFEDAARLRDEISSLDQQTDGT